MSCDISKALLILQPFRHFAYVTTHFPTLPSQLILQPFRRSTYFTTHSLTLPLLHLRHSSFFNPSLLLRHRIFTYVTWRAAHGWLWFNTGIFTKGVIIKEVIGTFRVWTAPQVTKVKSLWRRRPEEGLENEVWRRYSSTHSPTFPLLRLRHNSFSNPSVASPTSQLILQPFSRFAYVTAHFPSLPLLHLRHSSFSNPSFASLMSQALHLGHLASSPWFRDETKLNTAVLY